MNEKGMGKIFVWMFGLMAFSLILAFTWDHSPIVKNSVHAVLDPSIGTLIQWNLNVGMLILVFIISLATTLVQKYATDQEAIRELKAEQKELQKEVQQWKHDPQKTMEINKKNMARNLEITGHIMRLSMKASIFTIVPFILLFRWFQDIFSIMGNPKFFGFLSWFWFYLIFVMIFSSILRKWMKVA